MEEIGKAIELAIGKFKEEFGEDAVLDEGMQFVTIFNNGSLIISLEEGNLKTEFIGGIPYKVDMNLSIFKEGL